jgi:protein gp37
MGIKTNIEWCDSTCNVLIGCKGCELSGGHCYAEDLVTRHAGQLGWPAAFDQPTAYRHRLAEALRSCDLTGTERPTKPWLNGLPRLVFVNDLADPFGFAEEAYFLWFNEAVKQMADSPHVWILLTKQPDRMATFVRTWRHAYGREWPRNVWGGVSVTGPNTVNRIAELVKIPLAVRLVSFEPLLKALTVRLYAAKCPHCGKSTESQTVGLRSSNTEPFSWFCRRRSCQDSPPLPSIDWVIAGGESGPNARPMHPDWARSLRDQCQAAGVPFFFKQWGEWVGGDCWVCGDDLTLDGQNGEIYKINSDNIMRFHDWEPDENESQAALRVGKKNAGRLLDGREWSEMPTPAKGGE